MPLAALYRDLRRSFGIVRIPAMNDVSRTVLVCPDDLSTLNTADNRLCCTLCGREFSASDGVFDLLPLQSLNKGSSEIQRLENYSATYSRRPDRFWLQPMRTMIAELGNAYLYSWAARRIEEVASGRSLSILDAACGDGMLRRHIDRRHSYIGVDFSAQPLARAARHRPANYFRGDLNHLPFAGASFDLAVSLQSLQYLDRSQEAIRQIARVVKAGGHFLLSVPNGGSIKYRLKGVPPIQLQKFYRENLCDLLSQEFRIKEITTRGLWLPFPKLSIHLAGQYPDSLGLSWTTVSMRPA